MLKASIQLIVNTINDPDLPLINLKEAQIILKDEYLLSKKNEGKRKIIGYLIRLSSFALGISFAISLAGYLKNSFSLSDKYLDSLAVIALGALVLMIMYDVRLSKEDTAPTQRLIQYGNILDFRIFKKKNSDTGVVEKKIRHLTKLQSDIDQYNEIN